MTGTVVIFDVFRASNTLIALLAAGVCEVLLVADLDRARALKRRRPGWPLLGERCGLTPADFDGGNSPASAHLVVRPGDTAILTTSAGTQAVARLANADPVLFASFANAAAVVAALARLQPPAITLLPMGLEAREPAVEDDEAALWVAAALEGRPMEFGPVRERLLSCDGADRLRRLGQDDDLALCTALDSHTVIPWVEPGDPPRAAPHGPVTVTTTYR